MLSLEAFAVTQSMPQMMSENRAGAAVVEHAHGVDRDSRRHADDARAVVDRADRAGDVCAVAVAVAVALASLAIHAAGDIQIGVRPAARVDHRDGSVPRNRRKRRVARAQLAVYPIDARRKGLRERFHLAVFGNECDPRIAPHIVHPRVGNRCGVTFQRAVIPRGYLRAICAAVLGREPVHVTLVVVEDDDDVPGRRLRRLAHRPDARGSQEGGNRQHQGDSFQHAVR